MPFGSRCSLRAACAVLALASSSGCDGLRGIESESPGPSGPAPFAAAATCGECHPNHLAEWEASMHAYGGVDPVMLRMEELAAKEAGGSGLGESCIGCHAPSAERAGDRSRALLAEGVSCDVCHSMRDVPPVGRIDFLAELDPTGPKVGAMQGPVPNDFHESLNRPFFATSIACAPCHQVNFPNGTGLENTYREWELSSLSGMGTECQDCHMPAYTGQAAVGGPTRENLHHHTFLGVDAAFEPFRGIDRDAQKAAVRALLESSVTMSVEAERNGEGDTLFVDVTVENDLTGHSIPSGVSFAREMWIEIVLRDGAGTELHHAGALAPNGDLATLEEDPTLGFFGAIAYDAQDRPTPFNFRAVRVDESRLLPFQASRTTSYSFGLPRLDPGPFQLEASLRFRAVRPSMMRELGLEHLLPIDVYTMESWSETIPALP